MCSENYYSVYSGLEAFGGVKWSHAGQYKPSCIALQERKGIKKAQYSFFFIFLCFMTSMRQKLLSGGLRVKLLNVNRTTDEAKGKFIA